MSRLTAWIRGTTPSNPDNVLETYALPNATYLSPTYTVTVSQGTPESSPVLYSTNPMWDGIDGSPNDNTRRNHWTQFSYAGDPVTIVVTLASASPTLSVAGAEIRCGDWCDPPTATVNVGARTVTFTVTEIGQYYVCIPSLEKQTGVEDSGDPLFIFVSEIDTNVPVEGGTVISFDPGGPYTIPPGTTAMIFEPGLHDLDPTYTTLPTDFQLDYGQELYIKGGAWVKGMINVTGGAGACKIRGRGTLSGEKYVTNAEQTQYRMIEAASDADGTFRLEGITVTDGPSKNFICNDNAFTLYDVKFFGITGDGPTMEDDATADLCFTKLNDDHYKFYHNGARITRATAYLQKVGPLIMCSWQLTNDITDCEIDGFTIVGADRPNASVPGDWTTTSTNFVFGVANLDGAHLTDYRFKNGTAWCKVWQLFCFQTMGELAGFIDGTGDIDGFLLQNISVPSTHTFSHFDGNGTLTGRITNTILDNVTVGGVKITSANRATYIKWSNQDDSATVVYL